jgi:ribosome assembly protein 1
MAPPKTPNAPRGTIHGTSAFNLINFTIHAIPLPESITSFLQSNVSVLKKLHREGVFSAQKKTTKSVTEEGNEETEKVLDAAEGEVVRRPTVKLEDFWPALEKICKEAGGPWTDVADKIWAFGPQRVGPNLLVDAMGGGATSYVQPSP